MIWEPGIDASKNTEEEEIECHRAGDQAIFRVPGDSDGSIPTEDGKGDVATGSMKLKVRQVNHKSWPLPFPFGMADVGTSAERKFQAGMASLEQIHSQLDLAWTWGCRG